MQLDRRGPMRVLGTVLFVALSAACAPSDDSAAKLGVLKTFVTEFVPITPGEGRFPQTFQMGSSDGPAAERPPHQVTLSGPFAIARYEVPQNLYEAVMGENPSRWKGPRNSAEMMTWQEARRFCDKVTVLLRQAKLIGSGDVVRLPTEAEWEYCCRAGTQTAYSFGDDAQAGGDVGNQASRLDKFAWHTGNAAGNDPPVGALAPNPWGLYDMHGYLWEFCEDSWHESYANAPAQSSPAWRDPAAQTCVIRGGSWKDRYDKLRCSFRRSWSVTARDDAVGFRCVLASVKPPK